MSKLLEKKRLRVLIRRPGYKTWELMTIARGSAAIRDYKKDDEPVCMMTDNDALELLKNPDSQREDISHFSRVAIDQVSFWRTQIRAHNNARGVTGVRNESLQAEFIKQTEFPLLTENKKELQAIGKRWINDFRECLAIKKDKLNDYDLKPFRGNKGLVEGKYWSSTLLEYSREGGELHYVSTGKRDFDFAMLAMELTWEPPRDKNLFNFKKQKERICPDGLAIRRGDRHQFFTIIEVKAEKDYKQSVTDTILQATCGALATYARRENICELVRVTNGRRPGCPKAYIATSRPSLGVHLLMANWGQRKKDIENQIDAATKPAKLILDAFKPIEYIAISLVEQNQIKNPGKLTINKLFKSPHLKK